MDFDDDQHAKIPKFKNFRDELRSVLVSFERRKDWPDLIKAIVQLQKTLQRYQHIGIMPEKLLLSKRLGQTLNPSLPSGVHRKVLETYEIIFSIVDTATLAKDLPVYLPGLFKLFPDASMDVKPQLMALIDDHFVMKLSPPDLRPCLGGFFCAVLPVLEEANSELYPSVSRMVGMVERNFEDAHMRKSFMYHLWENLRYHVPSRIACLSRLLATLPKSKLKRTQSALTAEDLGGDNSELATAALVACLQSNKEMVTRGALDVLNSSFMLHENGAHALTHAQQVRLVSRALVLMAREELPLTRRISKLFSGEDKPNRAYFTAHSALPIEAAFSGLIRDAAAAAVAAAAAPGDAAAASAAQQEVSRIVKLMELLGPHGVQERVAGVYVGFLTGLQTRQRGDAYRVLRTHVVFDHIADALQNLLRSGTTAAANEGEPAAATAADDEVAAAAGAAAAAAAASPPFGQTPADPPTEAMQDALEGLLRFAEGLKESQLQTDPGQRRRPQCDKVLRPAWACLLLANRVANALAASRRRGPGEAGQAEARACLSVLGACHDLIARLTEAFAEYLQAAPCVTLEGVVVPRAGGLGSSSRRDPASTPLSPTAAPSGFAAEAFATEGEGGGGSGAGVLLTPFEHFVRSFRCVAEKVAAAVAGDGGGGGVFSAAAASASAGDVASRWLGRFVSALNTAQLHRSALTHEAKDDGCEMPDFSPRVPDEVALGPQQRQPGEDADASSSSAAPLWLDSLFTLASHPPDPALAFFARRALVKLTYLDPHSHDAARQEVAADAVAASEDVSVSVSDREGSGGGGGGGSEGLYLLPPEAQERLRQRGCLQTMLALLWGDVSPHAGRLLEDTCEVFRACHAAAPLGAAAPAGGVGGGGGGGLPRESTAFHSALSRVMLDDMQGGAEAGADGGGGGGGSGGGESGRLCSEGFKRFCRVFDTTQSMGFDSPVVFREPVRRVFDTLRSRNPVERSKGVRFLNSCSSPFNVPRLFDPYLHILFQSQRACVDRAALEYVVTACCLIVESAPHHLMSAMLDCPVGESLGSAYHAYTGVEAAAEDGPSQACETYLSLVVGVAIHVVQTFLLSDDMIAGLACDLLHACLVQAAAAGGSGSSRVLRCRRTAVLFHRVFDSLVGTLQDGLAPPAQHVLSLKLCDSVQVAMASLGFSAENILTDPTNWANFRTHSPKDALGTPTPHPQQQQQQQHPPATPQASSAAAPEQRGATPKRFDILGLIGVGSGNNVAAASAPSSAPALSVTAAAAATASSSSSAPPPHSSGPSCGVMATVLVGFVADAAEAGDPYLLEQWRQQLGAFLPLLSSVLPGVACEARQRLAFIVAETVGRREEAAEETVGVCFTAHQLEVVSSALRMLTRTCEFIYSVVEDSRQGWHPPAEDLPYYSDGPHFASYPASRERETGSAEGYKAYLAHRSFSAPATAMASAAAAAAADAAEPSGGGGGDAAAADPTRSRGREGWRPGFMGLFSSQGRADATRGETEASGVPTLVDAAKYAFCDGYDEILVILNTLVRGSPEARILGEVTKLLGEMHRLHPWHFHSAIVHLWSEHVLLKSWTPLIEGPSGEQRTYLSLLHLTPGVCPNQVISISMEIASEVVSKHRATLSNVKEREAIGGAGTAGAAVEQRPSPTQHPQMPPGGGSGSGSGSGPLSSSRRNLSFVAEGIGAPGGGGGSSNAGADLRRGSPGTEDSAVPPACPTSAVGVPAHYEVFVVDFLHRYLQSLAQPGTDGVLGGGEAAANARAIELNTPERCARLVKQMPVILQFLRDMTPLAQAHAFAHPVALRLLNLVTMKLVEVTGHPGTYGMETSGLCRAYLVDKKSSKDVQDMFTRLMENVPRLMLLHSCMPADAGAAAGQSGTDSPAAALQLLAKDLREIKAATYYTGADKAGLLLASLHQQFFAPLFKLGEDLPERSSALRRNHIRKIHVALAFLTEAVHVFTPAAVRPLRAPLLDHISDPSFFKVDHTTLSQWRLLFSALVGGSDAAVKAMIQGTLSRIQVPTGVGSVFLSAEKEALNRARGLRRLAFLMNCSGQHLSNAQLLTSILEKLIESLKYDTKKKATRLHTTPPCIPSPFDTRRHYAEFPVVHRQILMCFRAIIQKTDAYSLAPFWPLIVSELIHILSLPKAERYACEDGRIRGAGKEVKGKRTCTHTTHHPALSQWMP